MVKKVELPKSKLIKKFIVTAISPIRALVVIESHRNDIRGVLTINPDILVDFIELLNPELVIVPNPKTETFPDDFDQILKNFPVQTGLI